MTDILIVGAGPAGVFAAITCKARAPEARVRVLEKGPKPLAKVAVSGGGRCNLTNACFDPREMASHYPRGGRELIGPLTRFGPAETMAWFEARGVPLKTEADGRVFPESDSSQTIIDCLLGETRRLGVEITTRLGVTGARARDGGGFDVELDDGSTTTCNKLMLATGGHRRTEHYAVAAGLGHTIVPPVPSLFTFNVEDARLKGLAGVSVTDVELKLAGTKLRRRGPLLVTGWGLSGPAVLVLSARGARALHERGYAVELQVDFIPEISEDASVGRLKAMRSGHPRGQVVNQAPIGIPKRLWRSLASAVLPEDRIWGSLTRAEERELTDTLKRCIFAVKGKSTNKDEFVTCGGVSLREVDFRTMESRACPGLFLAGELLDIDGVTGGFNFQACWTGGRRAGECMHA